MPTRKRHKTPYPGVYWIEAVSVFGEKEKVYYIRYRKNGRSVDEKAGRQVEDNMTPAKASILRADKIKGVVPTNRDGRVESRAEKWTFERLLKLYGQIRNPKSMRNVEYDYWMYLRDEIGNRRPEELIPLDIDRIRIGLSKRLKPKSVSNILEVIRRLANFGAEQGLCHPLSFRIRMPHVDNIRTETLSLEEIERLITVLNSWPNQQAAKLMLLALYTGMRKSELLRLQWNHVDFERGFITLFEPKGGKTESIPMNAKARSVLDALPKGKSPFVFRMRTLNSTRTLKPIIRAAGLPESFRPLHGMRHVFASLLVSAGVDLYHVQRLLTHKTQQMTARYAHLGDQALRSASEVITNIVNAKEL